MKEYRAKKKAEKANTVNSTEQKPAAKKAATKKPAKKPAAKQADSSQLQVLLMTFSSVLASRPGFEMWRLTPEEIKSIADPLTNMMAKNDAIGNALEEHGDAIALVTAIAMIAFPRVLQMQAQKKQEGVTLPSVQKGGKPHVTDEPRTKGHDEGKARSGGRGVDPEPSATREVFGGKLHDLIPSVGY